MGHQPPALHLHALKTKRIEPTWIDMNAVLRKILRFVVAFGVIVLPLTAAAVELQLVRFDDPAVTVDKLEQERAIINPISTPNGAEMRKIGIDYTGWARNVLLDGKPIFERYYEGKYIDRLPLARVDLPPGDHTIWPGNHVFTIGKDGAITTKSPDLLVNGGVVQIKCYPVTLAAYVGNPLEDVPITMRTTPLPNLTLRDASEAEADKPRELLPLFDKFAPLTLWLPANTTGAGYVVHPLGLNFQLGAAGVKPAAEISGLEVKGNVIDIPVYEYPVSGDASASLIVAGVSKLIWPGQQAQPQRLTLYPRQKPFELLIAKPGPALDVTTSGFPFKAFTIDVIDRSTGAQQLLAMELAERHAAPGGTLAARVRAIDGSPATAANGRTSRAQATAVLAARDLQAVKAALATAEKGAPEPGEVERAKAAFATAEARAKVTAAAVEAAAKEAETTALENPLHNAAIYGRIRPYAAADVRDAADGWQDLVVTPAADGVVQLGLPDVPSGVYALRLGVVQPTGESLFADQWITITRPETIGIGLFTQRGRDTFFRGESLWIGLSVLAGEPLPAGDSLELDCVDEGGRRLPLLRDTVSAIDTRQTFVVQLDGTQTLCLAAGRYRVEARVGSGGGVRASAPLSLEIVEPEPRTHFTNLLNGKYNALGANPRSSYSYSSVVTTGQGAERLATEIVGMGFNAFMGMNYDMSRVHRHGQELEQLVRERPELGPAESFYQPSGRDRFLNAAVRRNLRFYENMFTYNDCMLPRDPMILEACERYVSLETASMRFSPAFQGVCLYDEFYETGDNSAPRSVVAAFFRAQEMRYRDRYPGVTSADAMKALDRFTGRPAGQRRYEDLAKFRTWPAHRDSDWKVFSDRMTAAVKDVAPETRNWTLMRGFGGNGDNLAPNGVASDVFDALDVASTVMYKDGGQGDRPVYAPMMADVLRVRDNIPVWTQIHDHGASGIYGSHLVRQAFLGLSQNIQGFSYFNMIFDPAAPSPDDNRDTVRTIADRMLTPYGDFLSSLDRGYRRVAVFYSRESAYLASRKPNKLDCTAEGLWVACLRAGFPADFLYDGQLLAGKGADYDVIFAPGYAYEDEASPPILEALRKLVAAGKSVIVEKSSRLPIEGIVRINSEFDEYDDKLGGAFPRYIDFETRAVWDGSEKTTKVVRDFLSKKIPPAAIHDRIVGPDWLKGGRGEYLVVTNFAPTGFTGSHLTLYQAPDVATLRFPARPGNVYDVLAMKPVAVQSRDEWMTLKADLRHLPGAVYAFLPAAIEKVVLQADARLAAGSDLNIRAGVAGPDGQPIDAVFPIEITITDPEGKNHLHVYRAARPLFETAWRVPVNAAAGAWMLRVRELIGGTVAEAAVEVAAAQRPAVVGRLDSRRVWIDEPEKVRGFIEEKPAAGDPEIVIAIDAEQPWVRPHAEALVAALVAKGRAARIAGVSEVVRVVNEWGEIPVLDGGRLWRGTLVDPGVFVDAPVILLGKRYENRLIEALARRDVFPEVVSANFPAPGRAVIHWTRRGLSNRFDTVSILANDEAGLAAGVAALPSVAEKTPPRELTRAAFSRAAQLVSATALAAAPSPLRDTVSGEDWIRAVDVDPASGRILVGTMGYGDNLFCFSREGKLLWKQFLPEHHVYFARWIDGGRTVAAATGRGFYVFLLNGADGSVVKRFDATERPRFHGSFGLPNLEAAKDTTLQIEVNEPLRQILIRGLTGLMAVDFDGNKMWFLDRAEAIAAYPAEADQGSDAAKFGDNLRVGDFAISPEGTRIVASEEVIIGSTPGLIPGTKDTLWAHVPRVLDAQTGATLSVNEEDPGNERDPGNWSVDWPKTASRPRVVNWSRGVAAELRNDSTLGPYLPNPGTLLADGGRLIASPTVVERLDAAGKTVWRLAADHIWLPARDRLAADQGRFYRCDREGLVRCIDLATGGTLWDFKMPFSAVLQPVGDGLVAGAKDGAVAVVDASGKAVWQTRIRDHHDLTGENYPASLAAARIRDADSSAEFYPDGRDGPDDFRNVLRMGVEQLQNGSFESAAGWQSVRGAVAVGGPAREGKAALQLNPGQLVTQRPTARVIPAATYLLEFWYRLDASRGQLVAGALLDGDRQTFTVSQFRGRAGDWTFGRVAIKTAKDTRSLDVGFEAVGGRVAVDSASLRAVRFPSANLLANDELNAVEPTFVEDIRVQFEKIPPAVRERLMSRNNVSAFAQGITSTAMIYTQEQAFLHNGRIDDVGSRWTNAPDPMAFAVTLTKPSYVSHLVLYLNNATPDKVYPMISVLANDLETKVPRAVSLVRRNDRRFIVVHFPQPILTDALKIIPSYYDAHTDSLTEIELYGPLDGGGLKKLPPGDPDAVPMLMGNVAHVPAKLPADAIGKWVSPFDFRAQRFPPFASGVTVVDGVFSVSDPTGAVRSVKAPQPEPKPDPKANPNRPRQLEAGPQWQLASVTPTTTPARYAGRLLVGSADYKLHAIADNGTPLWSFPTGGRVYSSPVPQGDDVFFGSDDGKLYKVDVDSGILIWEFTTGGKVRGTPAIASGKVVVPSWDGFLYSLDAESGRLVWKAPIAPLTRATPAIHAGRVFVGDESGVLRAFDLASGRELWQQALGGRVSTCPVVTPAGIAFANDSGTIAFVGPDGAIQWKQDLATGVSGQPMATQTQLLVPTETGLRVLTQADGLADPRFEGPKLDEKVLSVAKWRDQLFLNVGYAWTDYRWPPRTYMEVENKVVILVPEAPPAAAESPQ